MNCGERIREGAEGVTPLGRHRVFLMGESLRIACQGTRSPRSLAAIAEFRHRAIANGTQILQSPS